MAARQRNLSRQIGGLHHEQGRVKAKTKPRCKSQGPAPARDFLFLLTDRAPRLIAPLPMQHTNTRITQPLIRQTGSYNPSYAKKEGRRAMQPRAVNGHR
ncbi:unnamed protein product [Nezara viridula]|uniref:Uncharacterized protein n=1 Tax=Nezara viridula TaxID=85310 RepID=A0A9P0MQB3_NEZVI|nr:unnamed protein product [Nezara viridula]